jgi:hypothetical protein
VQSTQVACPAGSLAMGGGAAVSNANANQVSLNVGQPIGNPPNGGQATAEQTLTGTARFWTITAYVLCAP